LGTVISDAIDIIQYHLIYANLTRRGENITLVLHPNKYD
jgi:hypothetical protein